MLFSSLNDYVAAILDMSDVNTNHEIFFNNKNKNKFSLLKSIHICSSYFRFSSSLNDYFNGIMTFRPLHSASNIPTM